MVLELQYTRGSKVLTHQFQGFFRIMAESWPHGPVFIYILVSLMIHRSAAAALAADATPAAACMRHAVLFIYLFITTRRLIRRPPSCRLPPCTPWDRRSGSDGPDDGVSR